MGVLIPPEDRIDSSLAPRGLKMSLTRQVLSKPCPSQAGKMDIPTRNLWHDEVINYGKIMDASKGDGRRR
jgi:hypothetical protein